MKRKILSAILILSLLLCACAQGREAAPESTGSGTVSSSGSLPGITDAAGRKITVRPNAKELTAASVYAVSAPFFTALGISDRVKAVNLKTGFWALADPALGAADTVGRGTVDLEKLAEIHPDVLIHRIHDEKTVEAVSKLGIDVICIRVESVDDVKNTLIMLGEYFGAQERAEKAIDWIEGEFRSIRKITDTIPEKERKTALLMGGRIGRAAGADMLQSWMIETAGGIPVVKEAEDQSWVDIGVERIFAYDPDVIFLTGSTAREYTIEELYGDPAWSALKAVRNRQIFAMPAEKDPWDLPGLSCVTGTAFMLRKMYPDRFSAEDLEDHADSYYRFMFGRCFDKELELDYKSY